MVINSGCACIRITGNQKPVFFLLFLHRLHQIPPHKTKQNTAFLFDFAANAVQIRAICATLHKTMHGIIIYNIMIYISLCNLCKFYI